MALSAGQQALVDVGAAFDAANAADVQLPALLHAATEMLKLYDLMFPTKGRVYDILKGDHAGHIKSLQLMADADRAAHPGAGDAVFAMLDREVAAKGLKAVRNDLCSGVCALLWLMRTVRFLGRFLDLLCDPAHAKQDAFECARSAYKECLYPYHRMVVSMIVPLALGVVGTRENLRKNFGMPTLEVAYEYIGKCCGSMTNVKNTLEAWLVAKGYDFPDLVGL